MELQEVEGGYGLGYWLLEVTVFRRVHTVAKTAY
jgi:hypothetical protein